MRYLAKLKNKLGPNEWAVRAVFKGLLLLVKFHFSPQRVWEHSDQGRLPNEEERVSKSDNPFENFPLCSGQKNILPKIERAHIVARGSSFDQSLIKELELEITMLCLTLVLASA